MNIFLKWVLFSTLFVTIILSDKAIAQNNSVETAGDVLIALLPGSALTYTLIEQDKNGTLEFAKGFMFNEISTRLLKGIIRKERPDGSNFNSFPSGHTSVAFQSASFIQKRYGWEYGLPAYALAGFVGYSRIQADKHDIIDVVAGMILGIGSTYLFTSSYQKEHMKLSFNNENGNYLLGFTFKF